MGKVAQGSYYVGKIKYVYGDLETGYYLDQYEIRIFRGEYQLLQVLWSSFVWPRPTNHPFPPNSLIAQEVVLLFNVESVTRSSSQLVQSVFCYSLICKAILPFNNFLPGSHFFLILSSLFSSHTLWGLVWTLDFYFQIFILYIRLITHSFFHWFQSNLYLSPMYTAQVKQSSGLNKYISVLETNFYAAVQKLP